MGSIWAPFWLHFGVLWGHFGLHLVSLGSIWAPFGFFGEAFGVRWASVGSFLDVQRAKRVLKRVSHVIFRLYSSILLFVCGSHTVSGIVLFFMSIGERGRGCAAGAAEDHLTCKAVFQKLLVSSWKLFAKTALSFNMKRASRSHISTG